MKRTVIILCVLALTSAFALVRPAIANDNWPHFRGPTLNAAVADNPDLPEQWSGTENVEWVTDVPGLGWSSPVVWGQRVFLTTVTAVGRILSRSSAVCRQRWTGGC